MVDYQLFGTEPFWHHLTNLVFHIANTLLLFVILSKMTGSLWSSGFVAAAFALHPLHVESVAWASERKDVLSAFFWMLTMWAYVRYVERTTLVRYVPVLIFFALGLMAKPMLVTLPFVLLLLDYWPLGRIQFKQRRSNGQGLSAIRLIMEKVPLFALAIVSSVITFIVQQSMGAVKTMKHFPLSERLPNAIVSYVSYIVKTFYPNRLAVLYPHPTDSLVVWQLIISLITLVFISGAVFYLGRRHRYFVTGWLWYLGTLVPVIGLIQVGDQSMADRYTYLPLTGLFIIIAWGIAEYVSGWRHRRAVLSVSVSILLIVLLLCTRKQVTYWKNSITLFEHTLEVTEDNYSVHNNYACTLAVMGRYDEAIVHFSKTLRIYPTHSNALENLGRLYHIQGKPKQAIECWTRLLQFSPGNVDVMSNLALLKATHKNPDFRNPGEAVALAKRACELTNYSRADLLAVLATAHAAAGKFSAAAMVAEKALQIAQSSGEKALVEKLRKRLDIYRSKAAD